MRDDTDRPRDGKDPSARGCLRLVHPAPPPKSDTTPRTRSGRRRPYDADVFTPEEEARLRVALKTARALFGTWACLADAMRVRLNTIQSAVCRRNRVSAALAVRLARALGKPLESLCAAPSDASQCPTCGRGAP
jgi:hypothetical protein